jgi:hypothetical protein
MALEAGSCTIAPDKTVSGTGLARAIAENYLPVFGSIGLPTASLDKLAQFCNGLATAIVDHIVANAEITVTVTTLDAGLQRTPNPNDPNTPTLGPASDVELTGSIT